MLNKLKSVIAGLGMSPYIALTIGGIFLVVFGVIIFSKFCAKKSESPKLNQAEILQAQEAVATKNEQKMREVLANSDRRVEGITEEITNAISNTRNATKNTYNHLTASELAAEIERRKHQ